MEDRITTSLQKIRAVIEAAERGMLIEELDLLNVRQVINDLLDKDCVMPATVAEVDRSWKSIEISIGHFIGDRATKLGNETVGGILEDAWAAYRVIEAALASATQSA